MDNNRVSKNISTKDEKVTITQSYEENGITKSVEVKEVENGFVVCISEYGYKKDKYINTNKTYISKTNPLEEESEKNTKQSFKEEVAEALKNLKL